MQQQWHGTPTEVAEREKGLSLWRRRINPDWQNLSPMCHTDPTSSKPLLGQEGVGTPHFPFSFFSALQWTLSPLLLCLWLSSCGCCCWVISQESGEDPTANLGASLELGSERTLQGSSTPANLGCGVPIPVLEISLLQAVRWQHRLCRVSALTPAFTETAYIEGKAAPHEHCV